MNKIHLSITQLSVLYVTIPPGYLSDLNRFDSVAGFHIYHVSTTIITVFNISYHLKAFFRQLLSVPFIVKTYNLLKRKVTQSSGTEAIRSDKASYFAIYLQIKGSVSQDIYKRY